MTKMKQEASLEDAGAKSVALPRSTTPMSSSTTPMLGFTQPPYTSKIHLVQHPKLQIRSTAPPLMITKDMYHALMSHFKTITRRTCNQSWLESHTRAFRLGHMVRVWSRPDAGSLYGALAGHVHYTRVFSHRLGKLTVEDVRAEGFLNTTVLQFRNAKFPDCADDQLVTAFEFVFTPRYM